MSIYVIFLGFITGVIWLLLALSGFITEFFGWTGMGKFVVESISYLDFPAMMGFTIVISIGYVCINLIVDILYTLLNPQIKG